MLSKIQTTYRQYPRQFWLMFVGMLLSSSGASMIWPFLLIYVSAKLNLPLTTVATLTTINALTSVFASFLAGSIADVFGRKWVMVGSLLGDGVLFLFMIRADTYAAFAVLMFLRGITNPLYRVGVDAMLADLIPQEQRVEAYGLVRMINNLGIAIGPAVGGFLAAASYTYAFLCAAGGMVFYGLLMALFGHETLVKEGGPVPQGAALVDAMKGYRHAINNTPFISAIGAMAFGWMTTALVWIVMPVYAKQNFGIPENVYGWIPTTNALIVVFLQVAVTGYTRRFRPLTMMTLGMFLYALANGGVALANGFWGFWFCMVIMSFGELVIVPTSNTFTANIAPVDMRGRYMSIYGLTWSFGAIFGPLLGGILNDNLGPRWIWIGGLSVGLISTLALLILSRQKEPPLQIVAEPIA
ncbi:MAG: MFS transporter [Anaerolineae bacterium]